MHNPLRQYIYKLGSAIGKLGDGLCQQAQNPHKPLNINGEVLRALNNVLSNLNSMIR